QCDLRVEPLDDRCVTPALGIIGQVVAHHGEHPEATLELEGEGGVVDLSPTDGCGVGLRAHPVGVGAIATQACAGPDPQQPEPLGDLAAHVIELPARSPSGSESTRLNSSHVKISYAVFCLKKKKKHKT